jgi:hypothetical protein
MSEQKNKPQPARPTRDRVIKEDRVEIPRDWNTPVPRPTGPPTVSNTLPAPDEPPAKEKP